MMKVIETNKQSFRLDEITTIKYILPSNQQNIIFIGYSKDSLQSLQYIYEVYNIEDHQCRVKGRINTFGIIFLSEYAFYKNDGAFLVVISQKGGKKIQVSDFHHGLHTTLVKSIKREKFQEESHKEWTVINYSKYYKKIFLLEISEFSSSEKNIMLRIFSEGLEVSSSRLIILEGNIPKIIFSPEQVIYLKSNELTFYKESLEPTYYGLQNLDDFEILGFFYEMILQYKADHHLYSMSMAGVLKPLLEEEVLDFHCNDDYLYFLIQNDHSKMMRVYSYTAKMFVKRFEQKVSATVSSITLCSKDQILCS